MQHFGRRSVLEVEPNYGRPHYLPNWNDANSGSATQMVPDRRNCGFINTKFTRVYG